MLNFDLSCKLHFESLNGNDILDQVALSMCLLWSQGCHKNQIHGLGEQAPPKFVCRESYNYHGVCRATFTGTPVRVA